MVYICILRLAEHVGLWLYRREGKSRLSNQITGENKSGLLKLPNAAITNSSENVQIAFCRHILASVCCPISNNRIQRSIVSHSLMQVLTFCG